MIHMSILMSTHIFFWKIVWFSNLHDAENLLLSGGIIHLLIYENIFILFTENLPLFTES